ncbi:MAG: penicillin-binding transpeptidase domain-containing protein [bacterium]|nr:penicillin-binding transpeptidase domain-containing protein [bacterium]
MAKEGLDFDEVIFDEAAKAKDLDYLEVSLSRRIFIGVAVAAIFFALGAFGRVFYLNSIRGEFYTKRASANANKEIVAPAPRGVIVDRFGKVLAENVAILSVFVDVGELFKQYDNEKIEEIAMKLGETLSLDAQEIEQALLAADLERSSFILIERGVTVVEGIAIRSLNSPFIRLIDDYSRDYINGAAFVHVVGYTGFSEAGNSIVGKTGLESYYDELLRGEEGSRILYRDAYGNILGDKVVSEAMAGQQLKTTIDADLQKYFYQSLRNGLNRLGRNAGVGIIINPQNGEILSLISLPSFDNNILIARGRNQEKNNILNSNSQPLFNRAVAGAYSPGSTVKPLVAVAALRENVIDPKHQIFSAGFIEIPNPYFPDQPSRFLDWKAHGWVDMRSALARSSNIYFYAVGGGFEEVSGLGINRLKEYWQEFGFGKLSGVDLDGENKGSLPDPSIKEKTTGDIWRIGDTYNVSIGQGDLLVSPLQLINSIAGVASGGKIYRPHLDSDITPKLLIDNSDWVEEFREAQLGMEDAVSKYYGTANSLSDLPMAVAGKTGSAQVANNARTNAFFVGYVPVETLDKMDVSRDKQIAILVLIENSREGSLNAVPIAKDVFEWYYYNRLIKNDE